MAEVILPAKFKPIYFEYLKDTLKVPCCLKCGQLFPLGFESTEKGMADWYLCGQNDLLCKCTNFDKIRELLMKKEHINLDDFFK